MNAPPPGMIDTAPQVGVAPLAPPTPEEPSFDYMPAGIDYGQAGAVAAGGSDVSGLAGLPPRALARNLAHQDFAESKAADTGHKTALDTSDPILDSIRANQEHLNRRSEKLQQFDEELSKQQQELMGNTPKQPVGMAMPDWQGQVGTLIAGLVRPGHMEAFTRSMLEQASDAQKAEFQNAMNAWQGRTSGLALQRKDLSTQIGDIDTEVTQSYRDEYQQGVLEDRKQGRADTLQSRADALEARTKQNSSTMYDRAWQQKNVEGIRRHGAELGLSPEDIEAEVTDVQARVKSDHARVVLQGVSQFRQTMHGILSQYGHVPEHLVPEFERQRALMAQGLSSPGDVVNPEELGVIPTEMTMKGEEFAVKLPFLAAEERAKLVKGAVDVQRARAAITRDQAMTSQGADRLRIERDRLTWEETKTKAGRNFDAEILKLNVKIGGKQNELRHAGPAMRSKAQGVQAAIDDLNGQRDALIDQKRAALQEPTQQQAAPPPLPGKRPLKGPIGSGQWGAPVKVSG